MTVMVKSNAGIRSDHALNHNQMMSWISLHKILPSAWKTRALVAGIICAAGLAPILFETSMMAAFVVPAAVSLAFGIVFATIITLFLIPSLYMIQDDGFAWFSRLRGSTVDERSAPGSETA